MGTSLAGRLQPNTGRLSMSVVLENQKVRAASLKERALSTPYFVVEEELLKKNLAILKEVMDETGCHILLAQKCFSMYETYPLIGEYLSGTTASGLYEARLGKECMGKENHVYSAAYREEEMDEIFLICDHIVFNSISQWIKYQSKAIASGKECGLRINPQCSTQEGHAIYDPCAPNSRMGITLQQLEEYIGQPLELAVSEKNEKLQALFQGISGLHFHTLCEQNSDDLETTLESVEQQFGSLLHELKWLNFGGGHHITRADYDREKLKQCIRHMQDIYGLKIYLEPGEAVALNAGYLVSSVLDLTKNGMNQAIMDTSAACHMPDVLEMPYTPEILEGERLEREEAGNEVEDNEVEENGAEHVYRLGGPTCLAGDIIGDYRFKNPLQVGDRLTFCDMAIYSMVKTNTFNGMKLPSIVYKREDGSIQVAKEFGYEDFKCRL